MASSSPTTTPKRLIVLCDGTWQNSVSGEAFTYPTNVTRISRALSQFGDRDGQKVPQIIYYQPGVGTGDVEDKFSGGVYGAGLSANVRAAYGFLAHNYNPGDQIYFFGYSRGAYTARAIAGLVTSLGLLTKKGMDRFGAIYQEYYRNNNSSTNHQSQPDVARLEQLAAGDLHPGAKDSVEIIGVWETVGFHGAGLGGEEFEFYNTALSPRVRYGFHALALDETREAFLPTLWDSTADADADGSESGRVKQVWFCGTHGIGGGDQDSKLADIALGWMVAECHATGTLSFVDIDETESDGVSYLLAGPEGAAAAAATGTPGSGSDPGSDPGPGPGPGSKSTSTSPPWATSLYPLPNPPGGGGLFSGLTSTATNVFWWITNTILPPKSGVRTPNIQGLKPEWTNERIHQSIRDRRIGGGKGGGGGGGPRGGGGGGGGGTGSGGGTGGGTTWPCAPIVGRVEGPGPGPGPGPQTTPPRWELRTPAGAVLQETVPSDVELRFKGKIRPVASK